MDREMQEDGCGRRAAHDAATDDCTPSMGRTHHLKVERHGRTHDAPSVERANDVMVLPEVMLPAPNLASKKPTIEVEFGFL